VVLLVQQISVAVPLISQFFGTTRLAGCTPAILECGSNVVCTAENTVTTPLRGCLRILTGTTPGKQHIQLGMAQQVSQPKLFQPNRFHHIKELVALGNANLDREPVVNLFLVFRTTTNKLVVLLVQQISVAVPLISQFFGTTRLAGCTPAILECGSNVVCTAENTVTTPLRGCLRILTGTTPGKQHIQLGMAQQVSQPKLFLPILSSLVLPTGTTTNSLSRALLPAM